ncbi:MAG: tRNA1(Val) (adenine(37)-N6)-methyltransferase [Candidatus Izemoplasmatales bacterium]|jgi:tRNA1(Val) A37 N6-methylase TrmN6|nr:tRNA1(Val) (adenine(37)-N6)-methyltransferase [Candidatus Izemoplasmatales bacterium]
MDKQDNREIVNDLLGYEGLKIIQRPDMFNFSLDSTLLADFVRIPAKIRNIMDFGTGNGPIPLFLTLKTSIPIIGVEIQKEAYELAKRSVDLNGLGKQITIINADINDLHHQYEMSSIDLITCNPPFFKYSPRAITNKNDYLTIARHELLIDLEGILVQARRLLSNDGTLFMIHRVDRLEELILALNAHRLAIKRLRFVYPLPGREAISVLVEASASGKIGSLKLLEPLYVYDESGNYSKEILTIFRYGKK